MKTNIKWIIIFSALIAVCLVFWYLNDKTGSGKIARVELDGEIVREIDLSQVKEPYEFEVDTDRGSNTIRVESGRIAVVDADCPDKVCVKTGYIENGTVPIVCLPHKLAVTVTNDKENKYDAVAGDK